MGIWEADSEIRSQGAEISRANIHVAELYAQLEKLVTDTASLSSVESEADANEVDEAVPPVRPMENGVVKNGKDDKVLAV